MYIIQCGMGTLFYLLRLHYHAFAEKKVGTSSFFRRNHFVLTSRLSKLSSWIDLHWAGFWFLSEKSAVTTP